LEHTAGRLSLGPDAPPRNESARERRIREKIEIASFSTPRVPAGVSATIRPAILVQPCGDLGKVPAETFRRNADPNANREGPLGHRDQLARIARHIHVPLLFKDLDYALGIPGAVNAKICREADTDRSWSLVAPGVRPISRLMTRSGDKRSSNKEAVRRGEARPRMVEIPRQSRPAPTQKPKERPASKGRVHMGRTRN
jgi:hypothetical protein